MCQISDVETQILYKKKPNGITWSGIPLSNCLTVPHSASLRCLRWDRHPVRVEAHPGVEDQPPFPARAVMTLQAASYGDGDGCLNSIGGRHVARAISRRTTDIDILSIDDSGLRNGSEKSGLRLTALSQKIIKNQDHLTALSQKSGKHREPILDPSLPPGQHQLPSWAASAWEAPWLVAPWPAAPWRRATSPPETRRAKEYWSMIQYGEVCPQHFLPRSITRGITTKSQHIATHRAFGGWRSWRIGIGGFLTPGSRRVRSVPGSCGKIDSPRYTITDITVQLWYIPFTYQEIIWWYMMYTQ